MVGGFLTSFTLIQPGWRIGPSVYDKLDSRSRGHSRRTLQTYLVPIDGGTILPPMAFSPSCTTGSEIPQEDHFHNHFSYRHGFLPFPSSGMGGRNGLVCIFSYTDTAYRVPGSLFCHKRFSFPKEETLSPMGDFGLRMYGISHLACQQPT